MKHSYFVCALLVFISSCLYAQEDQTARVEYEKAQAAFDVKDYKRSLQHLDRVEQLLGVWTPVVSLLRIENLDGQFGDSEDVRSPFIVPLYKEVNLYHQYLEYATSVPLDSRDRLLVAQVIKKMDKIRVASYLDTAFQEALKAYEKGRYEQVLPVFETLSQQNNPYAMECLADMLYFGDGTEVDIADAKEWYARAGRLGNRSAQVGLARIVLADGKSNSTAHQKAIGDLRYAENLGDPRTYYWLGLAYFEGRGVEKNLSMAAAWFKKTPPNDTRNAPDLAFFQTRIRLDEAKDEKQQAVILLSADAAESLPADFRRDELTRIKELIRSDIRVSNALFAYSSTFALLGGASAYYLIDQEAKEKKPNAVVEGVAIGLSVIGGFGFLYAVLGHPGEVKNIKKNRALIRQIDHSLQAIVTPTAFHIPTGNGYGLQLALRF